MAFWRLYYHFVWTTRERLPLIAPAMERELHDYLARKAGGLRGVAFAVGGTCDHVHLVAAVPPSIAVARFVGELKGGSSYHVNRLPEMGNTLFWQRGYGAVSVGKAQMDRVIAYVRCQKQRHAKRDLIPPLELVETSDRGRPARRRGPKMK